MVKKEAPQALLNSVLVWCPELPDGAIIAGGFIRAYFAGETPSDLDLYFRNEDAVIKAIDVLKTTKWSIVAETQRAITFEKDKKIVQVITYLFGEPEEIIKAFDFTICAAALFVDSADEKWRLLIHNDFFEHLAGRLLVFTGSPLPLASLKRAIKYVQRGYHICDENLISLARAIAETIDFENSEEAEKHIDGMDPGGERRIRAVD
ncbi:hypothetical protein MTATph1_CDS0192 [Moorella phage MTATph1]